MFSARGPATILVVEDDSQLRALFRTALTVAGYRVLTASDGIDALHQIEIAAPAAVVLDLGLPRVSGHDVAGELRGQHGLRDIPIVVVTGESNVNDDDFDCVLRKPITAEALLTAVAKCLAAKARRQPLSGSSVP
jgi:CheY-like chemotaxis protein